MFTRVIELTSESGKAKELANTIHEKVVPILKKQRGFVDETVLLSDTEPTRVLGLNSWNTKEDAERYHQEQYPKIHEMLKRSPAKNAPRWARVPAPFPSNHAQMAPRDSLAEPSVNAEVQLETLLFLVSLPPLFPKRCILQPSAGRVVGAELSLFETVDAILSFHPPRHVNP